MNHITKGLNQESIQEMNRSLLLNNLRKEGLCSRVLLSSLTGLKQATVTNIMKDFIEWGLVKEVAFLSGSKGRRSIGIEVNNDYFRIIGVRLARKHFSVGLFNLSGECSDSQRIEIGSLKDNEPATIMQGIIRVIRDILKENTKKKVLAIGVAVPGPFIQKIKRFGLITETQGWGELDIQQELQNKFKLPVYIEHDANAAAYAYMWNLKENYNDEILIYFAAGQGVGSGIIIDGQIFPGAIGTAGEIGHITININGPECACGNRGCLEKYTSSIAYTKSVNLALVDGKEYTYKEIISMYEEGNKVCIEKYHEACRFMGYGIINLINMYNPDIIIIGDEMIKVDRDVMYQEICETVKAHILPQVWNEVSIRMSEYEGDATLHGAAMIAINCVFENPEAFITKTR